jgi:hypothetical protein
MRITWEYGDPRLVPDAVAIYFLNTIISGLNTVFSVVIHVN